MKKPLTGPGHSKGEFVHRKSLAVCIALTYFLTTSAVRAEEPEPAPSYDVTTLTGDWDGRRDALVQSGWTFEAVLKVDALRNARGGMGSGSRAISNLDLKLGIDLEKAFDWAGASALIHVLDNRGNGLNQAYTGALAGVSNIEVPVGTTRLFQAWLQQGFADEKLQVLAGLYPIDSEFFVIESAGLLINPTFGTPGDLALTRGPSIFNNSAFGLRVKLQNEEKSLYAMGAVLDGIPNDPAHPKRTAVKFDAGDGAFYIGELGWKPAATDHAFGGFTGEKYDGVSKLAFGAWQYSAKTADQLNADERHHQQGAYVFTERTLFGLGEPGRDVGVFARLSKSDGNTIALDNNINIGMRARGLLASRPDDALLIGWTRSRLASKYRRAELNNGNDTARYEDMLELSWRSAITPYLAVQPVLQSISHPGGAASAERATVLGFRLEVAL